jgi:hypothetical protein
MYVNGQSMRQDTKKAKEAAQISHHSELIYTFNEIS